MDVSLSTATVSAFENTKKSMNLHYHPIVLFNNSCPLLQSHLNNISWEIQTDLIGNHMFNVELSCDSPFEIKNNRNHIEFNLTKNNVPFQHDPFECKLIFKATLEINHESPIYIEKIFWGVVKTKWEKGLN